ncbi:MAG: hypothetical protein H7329_03550 [Opitutaceae bacterium]|nr:hypothetical protein [Cytophagales bacterium]
MTKGDHAALAGVYTFSFLAVMGLLGLENILLKVKRKKLPRPEKANVFIVIISIFLISVADNCCTL